MVYVIDDDASVRRSLELLLRSYEMTYKSFTNGKEFLEQYSGNQQGVVILDLKMADMDARDFLQRLRDEGIGIPVIGITANNELHIREYCRDFGVKNIMSKPVDSKALMDIIKYYN